MSLNFLCWERLDLTVTEALEPRMFSLDHSSKSSFLCIHILLAYNAVLLNL
jgi:hypothetical protein